MYVLCTAHSENQPKRLEMDHGDKPHKHHKMWTTWNNPLKLHDLFDIEEFLSFILYESHHTAEEYEPCGTIKLQYEIESIIFWFLVATNLVAN